MADNSIGPRIQEVRKGASITQQKLADHLGINQGHLSKVERGVAQPSTQLIKAVARTFNISEQWLKTGDGKKERVLEWSDEIIKAFIDSLDNLRNYKSCDALLIINDCEKIISNINEKISDLILADFKIDTSDEEMKLAWKMLFNSAENLLFSIESLHPKSVVKFKKGDD